MFSSRASSRVPGYALLVSFVLATPATVLGQEDFTLLRSNVGFNLVKTPGGDIFGNGTSDPTAFRIAADGTISAVPFLPYDGTTFASDGYFYGVDRDVLFRFPQGGPVEILNHLEFGESVVGRRLVEGADGALYGATQASSVTPTRVFRLTAAGILSTVHEFTNAEAVVLHLTAGRDGNLYAAGGTGETGRIFRLTLTGIATLLATVNEQLDAPLLETDDGFVGVSLAACSAIFRLSPAGALAVLHRLTSSEGCVARTPLIAGHDGLMYGTTDDSIFSVAADGNLRVLHFGYGYFPGATVPYGREYRSLIQGNDGNVYGIAIFPVLTPTSLFRLNGIRLPCINNFTLARESEAPGGQLLLTGAIKSETPALLATWAITGFGAFPVVVAVIPAITPTVPYQYRAPMPAVGTLGLLSILITSDLHVCSNWQTVMTDPPAAGARISTASFAWLAPPVVRRE
jgi:hypothetical protein